jgi:hypothetical protein
MRDGWVEYTLDNVTECSWGNTETTKSKYVDSGYLAYSASGADGFLEWFEHDRTAVVLSAIGAQCGKTWFAEGQWTSIKNTIWLKSDNSNLLDKYLYYLSNRDQFWQIRGQAQPFISLGDVKKTKVSLPPLPEQKRIVDLISSVDSYLDSIKKLINDAHVLRSSVSESLWQSFKDRSALSAFGELVTGSTPSTKNKSYWDGHDVDFFTPSDLGSNLRLARANRGVSTQGAAVVRSLSGFSVLQVCIGATIGKVGFLDHFAVTNQQINSLTHLTESDAVILAAILSSETFQSIIANTAGGSTLPIISKSSWGSIEIPFVPETDRLDLAKTILTLELFLEELKLVLFSAEKLRVSILNSLLSGAHQIPASYEKVTGAA